MVEKEWGIFFLEYEYCLRLLYYYIFNKKKISRDKKNSMNLCVT